MPLIKSSSRKAIGQNISEMEAAGHKHSQAVAAALNNARRYGAKFAEGGGLGGFPGSGQEIFEGPIHSKVPGRTDRLNMHVKPGSYVVPADVVSGWGEGNTNAGHEILSKMFNSGPFGIAPMKPGHRIHQSRIPMGGRTTTRRHGMFASGGHTDAVPIVAAGGEHVLTPEQIVAKFGDLKHGHKVLDEFVVQSRKKHVKATAKLPGPKK